MKKRSKAKKKNKRAKARRAKSAEAIGGKVDIGESNDLGTAENNKALVAESIGVRNDVLEVPARDSVGRYFGSLEQAKEYWLLGEWEKLAAVDLQFLQNHSDRARFVLLVGAAHQQLGNMDKAKQYAELALQWGERRSVIAEVLLAGLYNVFGRITGLQGKPKEAINFFEKSIFCDFIFIVDKSLRAELRMASQLRQLNIIFSLFYKKKKKSIVNFDVVDENKKKNAKQLVVLGMHRSGTSCVTGNFHSMGAYFSLDKNAMPKTLDNPKGYFERMDALDLNDSALSKSCATWWKVSKLDLSSISTIDLVNIKEKYQLILKELNEEAFWIVKDPRLCLVFPLLEDLFDNPIFIHVYRNPIEVALSLNRRDRFPMSFGLALWEFYNKKALFHSKGMPKVQISYNDLLDNSGNISLGLKKHFYHNFKIELEINEKDLSEVSFVDKSLYRNRVSEYEMDEWLTTSQRVFWEMLEQGVFLDKDYHIPPISKVCLETLKNYELCRDGVPIR